VSGILKRRGRGLSIGAAVMVFLVVSASPAPAMADRPPKQPKNVEEAPTLADDPAAIEPVVVEGVGEVIEPAVEGDPSATEPARREKPTDPADDLTATKTKNIQKEKPTKPKDASAAIGDTQNSTEECKHQCQTSVAAETQAPGALLVEGAAGAGLVDADAAAGSIAGDGGSPSALSRLIPARGVGQGASIRGRRSTLAPAGLVAAGAQPSLAIVVDALNDADGDGIYSDSETAAESGAEVNFKAIVTNMGATAFEIAAVTQSFIQQSDRVQVQVCTDLEGLTLGFGESLACSFSVADYAPPMGKTVVSTVTASGIEIGGSKRRGTSDSDNTTVVTFLEDQVLAVAIERAPGSLAFTGTGAASLLVLGFLLIAAGGATLLLAGFRERAPSPLVLRLGAWPMVSAAPKRPRSGANQRRD
jgi:hypothetical protein